MANGAAQNAHKLGALLASMPLQLYQTAEGDGLLQIDGDRVRRITDARQLNTLLMDNVCVRVFKNGKYHGEQINQGVLATMLKSKVFLNKFQVATSAVTTPVILSDFTPSQPGYNQLDSVLYLGEPVSTAKDMQCINRFLDVMHWDSNASRTNAVAAFLTVPFRRHWPGGKPFILVQANKSHAGKTTVCEFINIDQTATARIEYDPAKDWPMQNQVAEQLRQRPEIGIISFDNVRTNNHAKEIRSAYLESFVTAEEIVIGKATGHKPPIWTANHFLVMLNTNEGELGKDLLNRSLPIRLAPNGDVTTYKSPIGNPKLEYLPGHRRQIVAERWGMIDRWVKEGKPLADIEFEIKGPCAKEIGGILQVNGFTDFLANFGATRAVADPIRLNLGLLGFYSGGKQLRAGELARITVNKGLNRILLPTVEAANESACERAIGILLSKYLEEDFSVEVEGDNGVERVFYRLSRSQGRFGETHPHRRYKFSETKREAVAGEPQGPVLENRRVTDSFSANSEIPDSMTEYSVEEA
jgi:hypothetical protein